MPESPRWLFAAGPLRTAQAAFGRLGTEVSREDLEQTARQLEAAGQRSERVRRGSWTAGVKRARIVVCVFFFAALCVLAIMFVRRFLPETKNRSRRGDHPTVRAAGPGGRRGAGSRPGLTTLRRPLPAGLTTLRRLRAGQARPAGVAGCARRHSSGQRLSRRCR